MTAPLDRLLAHRKTRPSPWDSGVYDPNNALWRATFAELSARVPLEDYAHRSNLSVPLVKAWALHGYEGYGIHPVALIP